MRPLRRSSCSGDDVGHARGLEPVRRRRRRPPRLTAGPFVERIQQPLHLEVGEREQVAQPAREERPPVAHGGEPADDLHADVAERVEVERRALRRAHELRRRQPAGAGQVVDLVVALVPHARAIHPPQHVAAAVGARQAHVLAHRERDRPARLVDFGGELQAGGGRPDDEHAAVGQLAGVAVVERGDLRDVRPAPPRAPAARWRDCRRRWQSRRSGSRCSPCARRHVVAARRCASRR